MSKKLKKLTSLLLVLTMMLSIATIAPISVNAATADSVVESYTDGDFEYYIFVDGTAEIACYNGSAAELEIPSELDGYTVTSIGSSAFYNCTSLTSITIPDSVTSIGEVAFYSCTNLTDVIIGNRVEIIGDYAFCYCTNLISVTIPDSVIYIGEFAFYSCTNLTDVIIGNRVEIISGMAFGLCESLESIIIPDSVINIDEGAFYYCTSLKNVTIPDSVTSIGGMAFGFCYSLKSITIPDSVTNIGIYALGYYFSLFYKVIDGFTIYGYVGSAAEAYANDNEITFVDLDEFYTSGNFEYILLDDITAEITGYNGSVANLEIPSELDGYTVTSIGGHAFEDCYSLTSITIPDSVASIGEGAFKLCTSLESVTIPNSVTSIGEEAFGNCGITSIEIPDSVTSIESKAFIGCSNLKSVTLSDNISIINAETFSGCTSLSNINIPDSVTSIESNAFNGCSKLKSVTLPDNISIINYGTFHNCTSLSNINIPDSVTRIEGNSIDSGAFEDCELLVSVTIPDSVTYIGDCAFCKCTNLRRITIPDSVTSIGSYAFYGCDYLTIYGYEGSYAQTYAKENNINFKLVGEKDDDFFVIGVDTNDFKHTGWVYKFYDKLYYSKLFNEYDDSINKFKKYIQLNGKYEGMCLGIAMTMCYGDQGYINFDSITSGATNYWELGSPDDNEAFHDLLLFCQLFQFNDICEPTASLENKGKIFGDSLKDRTKDFLKSLVDEAKRSEEEEIPFVFAFHEKDSGHAVVVCGYEWDKENSRHMIKIYDENSYSHNNNYKYMYVSSDYSGFSFQDSNAENGGYYIEDVWTALSYYGIDYLYSDKITKIYAVSANINDSISSDSKIKLEFTYDAEFKLENSDGEYISFDGENYESTMTVYDYYSYDYENDPTFVVTVDNSDSFTLTGTDGEFELLCTVGTESYAVIASNTDSVVITENGVSATGDSYSLTVATDTDDCDMLWLDIETSGTVEVTKENNALAINSEDGCAKTTVKVCNVGEIEEYNYSEKIYSASVDTTGKLTELSGGNSNKNHGSAYLTVNASSNYFGDGAVSAQYNENQETVTVTYYLQSDMKVLNYQFEIYYDNDLLAVSDGQDVSTLTPVAYYTVSEPTEYINEVANLKAVSEDGSKYIAANGSDIFALYDFTDEGVFATVTFDVIGSGEAEIYLDVISLTYAELDENGDTTNETTAVKQGQVNDIDIAVSTRIELTPSTYSEDLYEDLGDVNGDGVVDVSDVTYIQKALASYDGFELTYETADFNRDGSLDIGDATSIQKYLAGYAEY